MRFENGGFSSENGNSVLGRGFGWGLSYKTMLSGCVLGGGYGSDSSVLGGRICADQSRQGRR